MSLFGAKAAAGLAIRSNDVHLLALRGKAVASRVRVPLGDKESPALLETIRKAITTAELKATKLPVSIQSTDILFRFFTIPAVPKSECDSVVQFEARRYIPFKIESLLWDYRAVPSPANSKRLDVVFAAIPREVFARFHEAMLSAGVQPTRIEPMSVSLARLIEPSKASAGEFVCIVDVEEDAAHLAIVKHRLPYLTRDISLLPSAEVPPAADWGSPLSTAEVGTPLSLVQPQQPVQDVDPRAKRLLSELSVSMDFFMREYPSTTIDKVWLCGDEHHIGPWCGWLSEQLHCPVALGRPLLDPRVPGELPLSFASAVGLIAGASEPAEGAIDFLRRAAAKPAAPQRTVSPLTTSRDPNAELVALLKTPKAFAAMCVAAGLMVGLWGLESMGVGHQRRALERLRNTKPAVGWGLEQMSQQDLDILKQQADTQITLLKQVIEQRASVAAKLDSLVRSLPDGVWLTGLSYEDKLDAMGKSEPKLAMNGACYLGEASQELEAIQHLEAKLKQSEPFFKGFTTAQLDQINVETTEQPQYTYRTFVLNCDARRPM